MTTHGDQVFQFGGVPVGLGGPPGFGFFGDHYFVDYNAGVDSISDGYGRSPNKPFKTLSYAITQMTSNQNDVCWINGYSTVVETAMVSLTKNRCHFVGVNGMPSPFGYGAGAKISCTLSSGATNIATFQNTGVRNTFTGIKFENHNTVAQGLYAVAEGGEYSRYFNCEFYKSTDLAEAAAAELLCNGDSAQFICCTFGDLVNERDTAGVGSKQRPNVLFNRTTITGKVARDCAFVNCLFLTKAGHSDICFMYGSGATDIERRLIIRDSVFWNCTLASATVADAVNFGAAQTVGDVLILNSNCIKCTAIAGASLNIYYGSNTAQTTDGIAEEIAA
jgi:hypothetical protein